MVRRAILVVVVVLVAVACGPATPGDLDADGRADRAWIDLETGTWYHDVGAGTEVLLATGSPTVIPVQADYDGDGRWDLATLDAAGNWNTRTSVGTVVFPKPPALDAWSLISPVPGDYDGDGRAEPAWYRDTDAAFFILGRDPIVLGATRAPLDLPSGSYLLHDGQDLGAPADYDGDHITDAATWNVVSGEYRVRSSRSGSTTSTTISSVGARTPLPVPADYDGVGHAVPAVFDGKRGWLVEGHPQPDTFGATDPIGTTLPTPGDYDGDGRADRSVLLSDTQWLVRGQPTLTLQAGNPFFPRVYPATFSALQINNTSRSVMFSRCLHGTGSC